MTVHPVKAGNSRESLEAQGTDQDGAPDLSREAANMLELLSRQSESATPLSISSKAAQTVLNQF